MSNLHHSLLSYPIHNRTNKYKRNYYAFSDISKRSLYMRKVPSSGKITLKIIQHSLIIKNNSIIRFSILKIILIIIVLIHIVYFIDITNYSSFICIIVFSILLFLSRNYYFPNIIRFAYSPTVSIVGFSNIVLL